LQYRPFVQRVSALTGIPEAEADVAVQAVMKTLAEQISEKETHDLWSQLPSELDPARRALAGHGLDYDADRFVKQVAAREGVPLDAAREHVAATFDTLQHAVSAGELEDILPAFMRDDAFLQLWASAPQPPSVGASIGYGEFVGRVQTLAGSSWEAAQRLVEGTLATLAERITSGEAQQLAAYLPSELQLPVEATSSPAEPFDLQEMLRRVHERTGLSLPEADPRPVLRALREAVPDDEIHDVLSQLPDEIKVLFYEPSRP
jgi:uncharacterized protein (DUF2267 family)